MGRARGRQVRDLRARAGLQGNFPRSRVVHGVSRRQRSRARRRRVVDDFGAGCAARARGRARERQRRIAVELRRAEVLRRRRARASAMKKKSPPSIPAELDEYDGHADYRERIREAVSFKPLVWLGVLIGFGMWYAVGKLVLVSIDSGPDRDDVLAIFVYLIFGAV